MLQVTRSVSFHKINLLSYDGKALAPSHYTPSFIKATNFSSLLIFDAYVCPNTLSFNDFGYCY